MDDIPYSKPFWDGLEDGRFLIQECADCGYVYFPPTPVCPKCNEPDVIWIESAARGEIYAFTRQHRTAEGFETPVVLATVTLKEGPRLLVRMDDNYGDLSIGAAVELRSVEYTGGADRGWLEDYPFFRGFLV